MKRLIFLCAVVVAGCFLVTSMATAAGSLDGLFRTGNNKAGDEDREYLIDRFSPVLGQDPTVLFPIVGNDGAGNPTVDIGGGVIAIGVKGQIDIGDSIRGSVNFNTLNSTAGNVGGTTGNNELSGVVQTIVTSKVAAGAGAFVFGFGPDPAFQLDLGGGQVVTGFVPGDTDGNGVADAFGVIAVLFEDDPNFANDYDDPPPAASPPVDPASQAVPGTTTPGINDDGTVGVVDPFGQDDRNDTLGAGSPLPTPPSAADVSVGPYLSEEGFIATAYDGAALTHWGTIGFVGADGAPGGGDDTMPGVGEGASGITSGLGDNVLNAFGFTTGTTGALANYGLNLIAMGPEYPFGLVINRVTPTPFGGVADFAVTQSVRGVNDLDTSFEISTNTEISFNATTIPEPATMLLIGSGLIGLAALGRRRKRS